MPGARPRRRTVAAGREEALRRTSSSHDRGGEDGRPPPPRRGTWTQARDELRPWAFRHSRGRGRGAPSDVSSLLPPSNGAHFGGVSALPSTRRMAPTLSTSSADGGARPAPPLRATPLRRRPPLLPRPQRATSVPGGGGRAGEGGRRRAPAALPPPLPLRHAVASTVVTRGELGRSRGSAAEPPREGWLGGHAARGPERAPSYHANAATSRSPGERRRAVRRHRRASFW